VKGRDRRGAPRANADWPVVLETFERGVIDGHVVDISTSGARVRAPADLPVGAAVTLRITLPRGAHRLEVVARVARRDPEGLALDFIGLPETEARRVEPLVAGWDARRRAPRASRPMPVTIRVPRGPAGEGKTLDLSAFGARVATDMALRPGDTARLELQPDGDAGPLRLPSVVWSVADRGPIFVFVNLRPAEFDRLSGLVRRLIERGG
jgi:PilZ domain